MRTVLLASETDFEGWRQGARALRLEGVEPGRARFLVAGEAEQQALFDGGPARSSSAEPFPVARAFVEAVRQVIQHRAADRFDLMYRLLWRLGREPKLMAIPSDPDVAAALAKVRNVRRANHKMKAFVRFRRSEEAGEERWTAWFEPEHRVLEAAAPFFVRRFTNMRWSILTPDGSAHWNKEALRFGPAGRREDAPQADEVEDFWRTYYASTFNPARLRTRAMQSEMPKRYWKNLPEAALIPELVAASTVRTEAMIAHAVPRPNEKFGRARAPALERAVTDDLIPDSLSALEKGVEGCRRCPLWRDATHGVCGEGPAAARLMIVGEQPGDQEDLAGRPFVGPAGKVLNAAMEEAGLSRNDVFMTNAVKHFKHEPRGKRRLHKTPNAGEVQACRWWLDHERRLVRPKLILALGATAGLAVLGRKPAVKAERGRVLRAEDGAEVMLSVHPSYLLRLPDRDARAREREAFVADLREAARRLG